MVLRESEIPSTSILKNDETTFDYMDSFRGSITSNAQTIDKNQFLNLFLSSSPRWASSLLWLRDRIVKLFGLKSSKQAQINKKGCNATVYKVGDYAGMFRVFDMTDNEFILGEDDKHLNFRVSLLIESFNNKGKKELSISTVVKFNNMLGRLYFVPVKPIHRLIVRASLSKILQQIERTATV